MNNSSAYIDSLIADATDIIHDAGKEGVQSRIDDFMAELSGFAFQLRITGSSAILSKRNRDGMLAARGWLISQMANLTSQSGSSVSVSNQSIAGATASATVDIGQVINEVQRSELTKKTKTSLSFCLTGSKEPLRRRMR